MKMEQNIVGRQRERAFVEFASAEGTGTKMTFTHEASMSEARLYVIQARIPTF